MSRLPFDYDSDDYGHDDYEFMDSPSLDLESYEDELEDPTGSIRVLSGPVDLRELEHVYPEEQDFLASEGLGYVNQWDLYTEHAQYYEPWYKDYEYRRQQSRYWDNLTLERKRARENMRELWWRDPERARLKQRQKGKKQYWKDPEAARAKNRERQRRYRQRQKALKQKAQEQ